MAAITAALVKELRERTGEGMMDCKKALEKAGGDIEKAIDMRASGAIKAAKRLATLLLKALSPSRPTVNPPSAGSELADRLPGSARRLQELRCQR
jgi:hypothetical protein